MAFRDAGAQLSVELTLTLDFISLQTPLVLLENVIYMLVNPKDIKSSIVKLIILGLVVFVYVGTMFMHPALREESVVAIKPTYLDHVFYGIAE